MVVRREDQNSIKKNGKYIYLKSTENLPKNQSQIHQNQSKKSIKNPSWRNSGKPLEALGGQDRRKTFPHCFFEASWGRPGGLLEPSWRLDRRLGPCWARLGAVLMALKKRSQNQSFFGCLLGSDFLWILVDLGKEHGPMLALKWDPKPILT